MQPNKNNKDLQQIRDDLSKLNKDLFDIIGGPKSIRLRAKLADVSNNILDLQKDNKENNSDNSVPLL
jgi:hypothetical protein